MDEDVSRKKAKGSGFESLCSVSRYYLPDMRSTLKPLYNEPRYSESHDIVNKIQLPFRGFTKHITFYIVNKKGLTDLFAISRFECMYQGFLKSIKKIIYNRRNFKDH